MARPRKLPEVVSLKEGHTFRRRGYLYKVDFRNAKDERILKLYRHGEKELAESFAKAELVKIQNHGTATAALLTDSNLREAADCIRKLSAVGKTLTDATAHFLAHLGANESSIPVSKLSEELQAAKKREKKSPRYLGDLKHKLKRFVATFGERQAESITADEISQWLVGLNLGPIGQNNYRRVLVLTFNYGLKRKYCRTNPAADSDKVKEVETEVSILTPAEAAKLLEVADDSILPAIALGLFAGLRRSELESLDWKEIDFTQGHILVRAEIAKSARRRFIEMPDNLREWLEPHAKAKGPVTLNTHGFRKSFDKARSDAGLLIGWDGNELRHSFASYHLADRKDAGETSQALGHTSPSVVFKHYRKVVTAGEAKVFWSITPATAANVIQLKSA